MTLILFNIVLTCKQNNSATSLDSGFQDQVVPCKFVLRSVMILKIQLVCYDLFQ